LKRNKFVVYTALFGGYDDLLDPATSSSCDYICFTDDPNLKSNVWEIKVVSSHLSNILTNRLYKIKPHLYLKNYEASIYIDSNIRITKDPINLFNKYLGKNIFSTMKHAERNCIYKEALESIARKKSSYRKTLNQMFTYAREGYPPNNQLSDNKFLMRAHNNKNVHELMELWWDELNRWVPRDQLSLRYAAWKLKMNIDFISENPAFKNEYFKWYPHNENESRTLKRLFRKINYGVRWVLIYPYFYYKIRFIGKTFPIKPSQ
jgi:hypothetical protein